MSQRVDRHVQAARAYRKAIALQPGEAVTHLRLAVCLMLAKRWDECAEELRTAIGLDPKLEEKDKDVRMLLGAHSPRGGSLEDLLALVQTQGKV